MPGGRVRGDGVGRTARLTRAVSHGPPCDLLSDGDRAAADAAMEEFIAMVQQAIER